MTKPYDFKSLPTHDNFDFVTYAVTPRGSNITHDAAERFAITTALEHAKKYPDLSAACNLSFTDEDNLYIPVRHEMTVSNVFEMHSHMKKAEIFQTVSEEVARGELETLDNGGFKQLIGSFRFTNPDRVAYRSAREANDILGIQDALMELSKSALKAAENLFKSFDAPVRQPTATETLIEQALSSRGQSAGASGNLMELK